MMGEKCWRSIKHLWKSGCFWAGMDHFLVVLPSVLIVANIHRAFEADPIIGLSTILFMCGVSAIVFVFVTNGKIPFFMGPSFAHISLANYLISTMAVSASIGEIRNTLLFGYFCSGFCILFLALLYKLDPVKRLYRFLFPDVVIGPSISLIGLSVASLAVEDSGLLTKNSDDIAVSMVTLAAIILLTLTRRSRLQNASILLGVLAGSVFAALIGKFDWISALQAKELLRNPQFTFPILIPENWFSIFLLVIPPSIVSFIESLGRIAVLEGMYQRTPPKNKNYIGDQLYVRSLLGHSISHLVPVAFGAVPSSIYAENIAIMNINSIRKPRNIREKNEDPAVLRAYDNYSSYPYITAACLFMVVAWFPPLQNLFHAIPKAVIGGMELFIFALVAAPGIQMLVEKKVDYKKISNQIITGSVLIAGISGISIQLSTVELSGMGLGLLIGVLLNGIVKFLSIFGILNEPLSISDIIGLCILNHSGTASFICEKGDKKETYGPYSENQLKSAVQQEDIIQHIHAASAIQLTLYRGTSLMDTLTPAHIKITNQINGIYVELKMPEEKITKVYNDYGEHIVSSDLDKITIRATSMSPHTLKKIILML